MRLAAATVLAIAAAASAGAAQKEETKRVEVRVTSVTAEGFYLDRGSDAGLAPGDLVEIFTDTGYQLRAVVRVVTRQSARAEWSGPSGPIALGARGEALVPAARLAATASRPAHPPWEQAVPPWDDKTPLLAPRPGALAPDLALRFDGRTFLQIDSTLDREAERNYSFARAGLDFTLENLFGAPGVLTFDGQLVSRQASGPGSSPSDDERTATINSLSYAGGVAADAPVRYELGRFLQREFPEFGLLDGAEVTARAGPHRFGGSFGGKPDYDQALSSSDEVQAALTYRYLFDPNDMASIGAGFQGTWQNGEQDRDLLVLKGHRLAPDGLTVNGSAWIDFYGAGDTQKSSGPELTQLFLTATHPLGKTAGVGLFGSYTRNPETIQDALPLPPPGTDDFTQVAHLGANGWVYVDPKIRVSARAEGWRDPNDQGGSGDLRVGWRDLLLEDGELGGALFTSQGSFTKRSGFELSARQSTRAGTWALGYTFAKSENGVSSGFAETLDESILRASWDVSFGSRWSLSVYVEDRFGTDQDSLAVGLYLSLRL